MEHDTRHVVLDLLINALEESSEHGGVEPRPHRALHRVVTHTQVSGKLQSSSDHLKKKIMILFLLLLREAGIDPNTTSGGE